jgi:hypothetical protein
MRLHWSEGQKLPNLWMNMPDSNKLLNNTDIKMTFRLILFPSFVFVYDEEKPIL